MSISQLALARWLNNTRREARDESGIGSALTAEQQRIRVLEIEMLQCQEDNTLLKNTSALVYE